MNKKIHTYKYSDLINICKHKEELQSVVDSSKLFENPKKYPTEKDCYVYIYLDPRGFMKQYEIVKDIWINRTIVYVGYGSGNRMLHKNKPSNKAEEALKDWIEQDLMPNGYEPIILIFSTGMDKYPAEWLESNLQNRVKYIQETNLEYKNYKSPLKMFNRRIEKSTTLIYDIYGNINKN